MVRNRTRSSGFTLLELLISLVIVGVLMGGMAAAVRIAMLAIPDPESAVTRLVQGGQITQQILTELREARHFTERGAHAVAFTVADRYGDGSPESIRYAWSGTAGDPLTRQYNHGSVVDVAEDVFVFDLAYKLETVTEDYPGVLIESSEGQLAFADSGDSDFVVTIQDSVGQYFMPRDFLPSEAVSWTITKVELMAHAVGENGGRSWLQLRHARPDRTPASEVIQQVDISEINLSGTYMWEEFLLEAEDLSPTQGLYLLVVWQKNGDAAVIQYVASGGSGRVEALAGGSWVHRDDSALRYRISGTYKVPGAPQTATRRFVTAVDTALQIGEDAAARGDATARTLNMPEALSAYWELDFDDDPRTVDMNGDGSGDWDDYSGTFDPGTLIDGIWYASNDTAGVSTLPDEDFAELTTVTIRYRVTSVGGSGAYFWINADRHDGLSANLIADLYKPNAASQQLFIGHELADGTDAWLGIYDVPDDFVDVRLVIDPAADTFAVFINGTHEDTYAYAWENPDPAAKAWVYRWNCTAEFDHVSIRTGEAP